MSDDLLFLKEWAQRWIKRLTQRRFYRKRRPRMAGK